MIGFTSRSGLPRAPAFRAGAVQLWHSARPRAVAATDDEADARSTEIREKAGKLRRPDELERHSSASTPRDLSKTAGQGPLQPQLSSFPRIRFTAHHCHYPQDQTPGNHDLCETLSSPADDDTTSSDPRVSNHETLSPSTQPECCSHGYGHWPQASFMLVTYRLVGFSPGALRLLSSPSHLPNPQRRPPF